MILNFGEYVFVYIETLGSLMMINIGSSLNSGGAAVLESGLKLTVQYEPPSPKFKRRSPGCVSYRWEDTRRALYHGL